MPPSAVAARWLPWVSFLARQTLGWVVLVAGALKLPFPEASVQAVRAYQLLPFDLTRPIGYALPVLEVALGLLLITGTFTRIAGMVGSALMLAFVVGIASVWVRGISIDCGCFGGGGAVENAIASYPWHIAQNLGLTACGLFAAIRPASPMSVDSWLFRPLEVEAVPASDPQESRP